MKNQLTIKDELTEFLLYTNPNGKVKVEVILHNETVWLTQKSIASLFDVNVPAISKHMKNIFESGELQESSVISILETTTSEEKAFSEYDKFNRTQKIEFDFDKTIKSLQNRINQGKEDVEND